MRIKKALISSLLPAALCERMIFHRVRGSLGALPFCIHVLFCFPNGDTLDSSQNF